MENAPIASHSSPVNVTSGASAEAALAISGDGTPMQVETELANKLDKYSLESIVEWKIARFLDQIGTYYPDDLHSLNIKKVETLSMFFGIY